MKLESMLPFRTALGGLILLAVSVRAGGTDPYFNSYCSSENTGASGDKVFNIYNSMGSCSTHCRENYAFAVLQYEYCWCSNYIPYDQENTSSCDAPCPGYTKDQCGNKAEGLYGYVALTLKPAGTLGAPSSKTTTQTTPTSTKTKTTPKPPPPPPPTSSAAPSYTIPPSSTAPPYSTSAPVDSSSPSPTPSSSTDTSTSVNVTIVSVPPKTHTVTTTTPVVVSPGSSTDGPSLMRNGISPGATAGIVVGTLAGALVLIIAGFFLWRRRRRGDDESGSSRSPRRKGSVLSRTGLIGGARPQSMSETNYDNSYHTDLGTHSNSVRHSMMFGAGGSATDGTPNYLGTVGSSSQDGGSERRPSRPLVYDQRLNPSALFANHDNGSRVSMQDQQDYSRPLGVANPDFRYSFDSR